MKVNEIQVYTVPCGNRHAIILQMTTDAGISGIGEAGLAYGVGSRAVGEMVLELGAKFALGQDASLIERIWNDAYDGSFWSKGGGPVFFAALSAIEHALWDIRGKSVGLPVWALLGGSVWDRIPLYANGWWIGCESPEDLAKAGMLAVEEGYRALKFYPLAVPDSRTVVRHPERRRVDKETQSLAVERVRALRNAVGDGVDIYLDFGGGLSTGQTQGLFRRLEEFDVGFIEEPVDQFTLNALEDVSARSDIPVAVGERVYTRYGFQRILNGGAAQVLQPDVCNTGGIFETKKIAAMSEVFNVVVSPHNYGSPLATAVAAQACATLPNLLNLEFFPYFRDEPGYVEFLDGNVEEEVADGHMAVPDRPGLGVELRPDVVEAYVFGSVSL